MAQILVFGFGNPSRGDDALGPELVDGLNNLFAGDAAIDFLTDFQLQIENALDLTGRSLVLFADAHVSCSPPFGFERVGACRDDSYTTHAMSPAAVLQVYQRLHGEAPPPCYLLTMRGYRFGLGDELTGDARRNLAASLAFCTELLHNGRQEYWEARLATGAGV